MLEKKLRISEVIIVPSHIITRKFGLRPLEPEVMLSHDLFFKFERAVNVLIRGGLRMDDDAFQSDGTISITNFYKKVRILDNVKSKLENIGLKERVYRCASQVAYSSIREYKHRAKLISILAETLLSSDPVLELTSEEFPRDELLTDTLNNLKKDRDAQKYRSREFIKNCFFQVRNILMKKVKGTFTDSISDIINEVLGYKTVESDTVEWIHREADEILLRFLKKLSRVLTNRVKRVVLNKSRSFGRFKIDRVISRITDINSTTVKSWEKVRIKWRNAKLEELKQQLQGFDADKIYSRAMTKAKDKITVNRFVNNFFKPSDRSSRVDDDSFEDFEEFLISETVRQIEKLVIMNSKLGIESIIHDILDGLMKCPYTELKTPHFTKPTIPFGQDDDRVYKLKYDYFSNVIDTSQAIVTLSFFQRKKVLYRINGSERFYKLIKEGYFPLQATLMKKIGGGLILAIPFQLLNYTVKEAEKEPPEYYTVAGPDLGLKTFCTLSINKCTLDSSGTFHKLDKNISDFARYFIDQFEMLGKRDEWFLSEPKQKFFNYKRRLTNLQQEARMRRSRMDNYKNNHPKIYRHKMKFFRLRREYKRTWQKIKNLHDELVKQIATRILAVLQYYEVDVLRLEDLRWAKHTAKSEAGYFLATWQVHWFFAQVQETLSAMAIRSGIYVEWINPRDTSKRCSKCGKIGVRDGKTFTCPHCGFILDSDLNASREIIIAPISLNANGVKGGCPFPPTG